MATPKRLGSSLGFMLLAAVFWVGPASAFIPTDFESAAQRAPNVVVVRYQWRPFWLSRFEVVETLKGSVEEGATIRSFRQPLFGSERRSGATYLLLLDEDGDVYGGWSSCGTFNLLELVDGEVVDVHFYSYQPQISGRVTLQEVKRYLADSVVPKPSLLERFNSHELTLHDLLEMVRQPDPAMRDEALRALDSLGDRVHPIVPELLQILRSEPDHNLRYRLVLVVANVKGTDARVVETLGRLLREDDSAFVRGRVAREFWEMASQDMPISAQGREALIEALRSDPDLGVRVQVAKALGLDSTHRRENIAHLRHCVDHETGELQEACRDALREFGGHDR